MVVARPPVGLAWNGRWGTWSDQGVVVLATCVGVIEFVLVQPTSSGPCGADAIFEVALAEMRQALEVELHADTSTSSLVMAAVHWAPLAGDERVRQQRRRARAAFLGDLGPCRQVQTSWKARQLASGKVEAVWALTFDSASPEYTRQVAGLFVRSTHTGISLSLPLWWLPKTSRHTVTPLAKGTHWFDFAELFGEVETVELVGLTDMAQAAAEAAGRRGEAHLLAQFRAPAGACAMCEALTDRYLYNPGNKRQDDCHPTTCHLGDYDLMRGRLRRGLPASAPEAAPPLPHAEAADGASLARAKVEAKALGAASEVPTVAAPMPVKHEAPEVPTVLGRGLRTSSALLALVPPVRSVTGAPDEVFRLRRCGWGPAPNAARPPPEAISLAASHRRVVIGREDGCDVVIRHPHVSKAHATLFLQDSPDGWMLLIQDASSNGTFLNGQRLNPKQFVQLRPSDRVSFLVPTEDLDRDPLTYAVVVGAAGQDPSLGDQTPALAAPVGAERSSSARALSTAPETSRPLPGRPVVKGGAPRTAAKSAPHTGPGDTRTRCAEAPGASSKAAAIAPRSPLARSLERPKAAPVPLAAPWPGPPRTIGEPGAGPTTEPGQAWRTLAGRASTEGPKVVSRSRSPRRSLLNGSLGALLGEVDTHSAARKEVEAPRSATGSAEGEHAIARLAAQLSPAQLEERQSPKRRRRPDALAKRYSGVLQSFFEDKGFGFIACDEASTMFKAGVLLQRAEMGDLTAGDAVRFRVMLNEEGMPQAYDIRRGDNGRADEPGSMPAQHGDGAFCAGVVRSVNREQGYGVIESSEAHVDVKDVVQVRLIEAPGLSVGDVVVFRVRQGDGVARPLAVDVQSAEDFLGTTERPQRSEGLRQGPQGPLRGAPRPEALGHVGRLAATALRSQDVGRGMAPRAREPPERACGDIGAWAWSLGLGRYEEVLRRQYDSVSQIVGLYRGSIADLFDDVGVEDECHRQILARAICGDSGAWDAAGRWKRSTPFL